MKLKSILAGAFSLMLMASCSDANEPVPDNPGTATKGERYIAVTISNTMGSRAEGDQSTDNTHNTGTYEEGYASENKINTLRFYFFDANNNGVLVSGTNSWVDAVIPEGSTTDMPNVEKKIAIAAIEVANNNDGLGSTNIKSMVAIANYSGLEDLPASGKVDLQTLKDIAYDYSARGCSTNEGEGFIMTSSVYTSGQSDANQRVICEVPVTSNNICTSASAAAKNPVNVFIERVVAKVRASHAWSEGITVKTVSFNGSDYKAVKLQEKKQNESGEETGEKVDITVGQKNVYAIITGWNVTNTPSLNNS